MKSKALMAGFIVVAVTAIVTLPAAFCRTELIDRIIARVNEEIITQRQFNQQEEDLRAQLAQRFSGEELEDHYNAQTKDLLREMIDEDLLVQKAKDLNINAETDLVQRLDQIRQQMGLATIQDLENVVEKQGLIWEDFQDKLRRQILTQRVIGQEVMSRIMPTDAELRKYFEQHRQDYSSQAGVDLAEVQISSQKWGAAEAEQRAKAAEAMLQGGAKWESVVKKYSDGPNATSGGEVGFFPNGALIPEISAAVQKLEPEDASGLISTQYGYVIVKLQERRSTGDPKFEEVRERVGNDYYQSKEQAALRSYLTTLRKESCITIAPGFVDTGALHPGAVGTAQDGCQ